MNDPIGRLRGLFEKGQRIDALNEFARQNDEARLEEDWKAFVRGVLDPAFAKVGSEVFREKLTPLSERTDPGFKVKDKAASEFWFWIEFRGRSPVAQARRKFRDRTALSVVPTPHLCAKPGFDLADITEEDVLNAIVFAYEKSSFAN